MYELSYFDHKKKIVFSSNCETGPREILENGKNGYLFKIYDYRQLAKKKYFDPKNFTYPKQKAFRGYRSLNRFDLNRSRYVCDSNSLVIF